MARDVAVQLRGLAITGAAGLLLLTGACAKTAPVVVVPDVAPRLDAADALLSAGCYDCLADALRAFDAVTLMSGIPAAASERAVRGTATAALLLELRARELGLPSDDFLSRARKTLESRPDLSLEFATAIETVEAEPSRAQRFEATDPAAAKRRVAIRQNLAAMIDARRGLADGRLLAAYTWLSFVCAHGTPDDRLPERIAAPLGTRRDTPLVAFRTATCTTAEPAPLTRLLEGNSRFGEINFFLAQAAAGRLRPDEAEVFYQKAFQWRSEWPAVTASLGHLYVAFEEFERALEFYDRTVALIPGHPEGRLGRIRALSYLERHDEAFAAIDEVLNAAVRIFPGEAYYWQAWNHVKVGRLDDGWTAIEQAGTLWLNSEVAKLAGLIAYQRRELDVALARFQSARRLNPQDCEVLFNIGSIQLEGRNWDTGGQTFQSTASCLENARLALIAEIATITASDTSAERKARQTAKRQDMIVTAGRMLATSYFNAAVSNFNLTRPDAARLYAEKVLDDERFGERARELLMRLDARR